MDELIKAICKAMKNGRSTDDIYQAVLDKGWKSDDAFLAMKAGENLYKAIKKQEEELAAKPPPFGRK